MKIYPVVLEFNVKPMLCFFLSSVYIIVKADYKLLQILRGFRGPHIMIVTMQSKCFICACALTVYMYIPKTSRQILYAEVCWPRTQGFFSEDAAQPQIRLLGLV